MQDKMERLLNQIGMNKDYLENASIDKIIVYEKIIYGSLLLVMIKFYLYIYMMNYVIK